MEKEEKQKPKEVKVRYIGRYDGESPILKHSVVRNQVVTVSADTAALLISSGQFEKVETKKTGGEKKRVNG